MERRASARHLTTRDDAKTRAGLGAVYVTTNFSMKVLITFAVEAELAPWRKLRKLRDLRESKPDVVTLYRTQIGRAQVDFVVTGMGAENATRVANIVMAQPYTVGIAAGFAGALKPEDCVGTVVVADTVQQLGESKTLSGSRNLVYAARDDGAKMMKLLSSDHVVRTTEEKAQLSPFAGAVDMESFAILTVAAAHELPVVAIRVISDANDGEIPAFVDAMLDAKGRLNAGGVICQVARHPLQLPALIRLGRDSKTAAESLAHFLEAFVKKLSMSSHGWPPPELQEVAAR
jgi:adenosylhomocysteine nucleosidase